MFCMKEFEKLCKMCVISWQKTTTYTNQQNRVAEMMNKTFIVKSRIMLSGAELGLEFQIEAMCIACYLVNRSTSSALDDKTPHDVWIGKKPSRAHLWVFGCDQDVYVPKENINKLDRKSKMFIFIGYKDGLQGYKLWNSEAKKVVYTQDVIFKEVKYVIKKELLPRAK